MIFPTFLSDKKLLFDLAFSIYTNELFVNVNDDQRIVKD